MKTIITFIFIAVVLLTGGCSGGDKTSTNENVFKEQTKAIEKAKQVEDEVMKQAEQQKQAIEQQIQE